MNEVVFDTSLLRVLPKNIIVSRNPGAFAVGFSDIIFLYFLFEEFFNC